MSSSQDFADRLRACSSELADTLDADILLFNGELDEDKTDVFRQAFNIERRRKNIFLVLTTNGGDAHFAFRIARRLQREYERFIVCIAGMCKSAGALLAIGAHEILMSDEGELGPLDVQVRKPDELWEKSSGLTDVQALETLRNSAFQAFEQNLLTLKWKSGITMKTCLDVATQLTIGLFNPIYNQIDPMRLGENSRAMRIGEEYGERLNQFAKNLKGKALQKLLATYPSHSFVIDRRETKQLFQNVREPQGKETELVGLLGPLARDPQEEPGLIMFLSQQKIEGATDAPAVTPQPGADGRAKETSEPASSTGTEMGVVS